MREILFKAKRTDNGEWVEGFYNGCYSTATMDYLKNGMAYNVMVDPGTVCQYTGLTDDKGVKIFEGDIVAFCDGHDGYLSTEQFCEGTVLWDDETVAFYLTNRIEAESHECLSECVIIGNIHDKEVDGDDEK